MSMNSDLFTFGFSVDGANYFVCLSSIRVWCGGLFGREIATKDSLWKR